MHDRNPPIARNVDPWTSHAAGAAITVSGRRRSLVELCLECVYKNPGLTAGERGEHTGLGNPRVWRRLSDLKNLGRVIQGAARQWNGKVQVTWWPLDVEEPNQQGQLL